MHRYMSYSSKHLVDVERGNIFQQVYTLVGTIIAGYNLGHTAIAAILEAGWGVICNHCVLVWSNAYPDNEDMRQISSNSRLSAKFKAA